MSVITRTAAIAALLLASACSGQPEVLEPDPTAETTVPSVAAPPLPEQANESTDEGAAAAAYHWVELFNHASTTGDVRPLRRYSRGCETCLEYTKKIAELPAADRPEGDPWKVEATNVNRDSSASDVRFSVKIPDGSTEDIAFELSSRAPYSITDLYFVEK